MVTNGVLLLDSGNTRVKYSTAYESGYIDRDTTIEVLVKRFGIASVVIADVAGRSDDVQSLCKRLNINCLVCSVENNFDGLNLIYRNISTLGVDRWLAMLGARSLIRDQNMAVVDLGTAVKIDLISARGNHLGGSISPGLNMSMKSLTANTYLLPSVDLEFEGLLGTDTTSCIQYGIVMSIVALIDRAMLQLPELPKIILTGGDASLIKDHLANPAEIVPDLVMLGLNLYQKKKFLKFGIPK